MTRQKLTAPCALLAAMLLSAGCGKSGPLSNGPGFPPAAPSPSPPAGVPASTESTGCGAIMDETKFADAAELRRLLAVSTGFGLRSPGSEADKRNVDWIESQLRKMPGMAVRSDAFDIKRWQPTPSMPDGAGRDLERAASLSVVTADGGARDLPVAGAVPYSLGTGLSGRSGSLVYLTSDVPITADNARGKVVLRDFPSAPIPNAAFVALAWVLTPDSLLANPAEVFYDRPYLGAAVQDTDLQDAGRAGAAAVIFAFNVPREQVAAYWDPHNGTHFTVPAIHVGVDEGEQLKQLAASGGAARVSVLAERDVTATRNLIATLPGVSAERIVIALNSDGNTWVQENGVAGALALADYLSRRPVECRPRTIEFLFAASHLAISTDGTARYAKQADADYDAGTVAFAFVIEHLGTREILPVARTDGPGERLVYSGRAESMGWFVGESPALVASTTAAVNRRNLDRVAVLRGADVPDTARVPVHCSFGGLGTAFQGHLIPTMAIISGPWSLWAPSFGEEAVDFERMRNQLLAVGDVILELGEQSSDILAGAYTLERQLRAAGAPTCSHELPPEEAPPAG